VPDCPVRLCFFLFFLYFWETKPKIYIAGIVLAILAVLDIIKKPISAVGKIITAVLVLATSWIGLLVYYLYAKDHLTEWFK
jgi:hypothetical protein